MFFSTVWGWIKRWFDPITVSKIFILSSSEVGPTLRQFIDPENIPKKYGGTLYFSWGDLPTIDPAWEGVVEWEGKKGFPTGPHVWRDLDEERMECVGVGLVGGVAREERICTVKKSYWGKVVGDGVQEAEGEKEEQEGKKGEEKSGDETLADDVDKLDISGEEKGKEMNGKDISPPISPALPNTVA